jgi:hypothetical protein
MYAGGLLALLLMLGLVLLVIALAMFISEPRELKAPSAREHPSEITRRLRAQGSGDRRGSGSHGATG